MNRIIYKITHTPTGRGYVGQTKTTLKNRFQRHCCNSDEKLSTRSIDYAIRTLGKENFSIELLNDLSRTIEESNRLEILYIEMENTFYPNGFNLTKGGTGKHPSKRPKNPKKNPTTGYLNVVKERDKFMGTVRFNHKTYKSQVYSEPKDAALWVDLKLIEFYGDNTPLNFPENLTDYKNGKIKCPVQNWSTSKYIGVFFDRGSWVPYFNKNKKCIKGAYYSKEDDAALVSDIMRLEEFGDGAELNFPKNLEKYLSKQIEIPKTVKETKKTSKYIGVSRSQKGGKFTASITINKKTTYLGFSEDEIECAKIYDIHAVKLLKDAAVLNFPENLEIYLKSELKLPSEVYRENKTSKFNWVMLNKKSKSWVAHVRLFGKNTYLGAYEKESSAALSADIAASKDPSLHSFLNFPENLPKYLNNEIQIPETRREATKTSKYNHVWFHEKSNVWRVRCYKSKEAKERTISASSFPSEYEAALCLDIKNLEYYGEEAELIFPENKQKYKTGEIKIPDTTNIQRKSCKYKGVTLAKGRNRYTAQIYINRKKIHVGSFRDPILAAEKVDIENLKRLPAGTYTLNFPAKVEEYQYLISNGG